MKKYSLKRLLSLVLALCIVLSMGSNVYAAGNTAGGFGDLTYEEVKNGNLASGLTLNEEAVPEEAEIPYADDENVRVFIVFADKPVIEAGFSTKGIARNSAAMAYSAELEKKQDSVTARISKQVLGGAPLNVRYNFTLITNAVSATVKYGQIEAIKAVDGVEAVYLVPVYDIADAVEPNTITSGEMVGSYSTWANGYTGAGSRVAIIDTGLDLDHPSFAPDAFLKSLEETADKADKTIESYDLMNRQDVTDVLTRLNAYEMFGSTLTAENLYRNEKVPYGFNYVDEDLDITHDLDGSDPHGTHVAGIATANKYVPTVNEDGTTAYGPQEVGVVGVAPDAQLIVMKVFGKNGGAYADDYSAAIEDAILLDVDVVNLSLGSANPGFTDSGDAFIDGVFEGLQNSDLVVSVSAGNAGSWGENSNLGGNTIWDVNLATGGSPGTYRNSLTVASVNNGGRYGYGVSFENDFIANYAETVYLNQPFAALDTSGNGTQYEYVLIDGAGDEASYEDVDVEGKIVLVNRGTTSFAEKHLLAQQKGAIAVMIINNAEGEIYMNLSTSTATIPCVSILQAAGKAIKAGAVKTTVEGKDVYTGTATVYTEQIMNYNAADGYLISDFSSWGVPGNLTLKPEITAPGGNIYSTVTDGYDTYSGTSMAAPSIAGMSALVAQYIREENLTEKTGLSTRVLTQALLMSTATPLMEGGQGGTVEYSPRRQGAGLANAELATTSPSYILVGDPVGNDGKVKAELGDDPDRTGVYSFDFTVYNMSGEAQYYSFDSSILTEAMELSIVDQVFLGESAYKLSPSVAFSTTGMEERSPYDFDGDGDADKNDAMALLKWLNRNSTVDLTEEEQSLFDLNEDGLLDTRDAYLYLAYINGTKTGIDLGSSLSLDAGESATVTVTITLSDEDRAYLENFTNGIYVDGYIYVNSTVDLSIPVLAFYGNWGDSSMFENFAYAEYAVYGAEYGGYLYASDSAIVNSLVFRLAGSSQNYLYQSNAYAYDEEYLPERNAWNSESGDKFTGINYSLIRNAENVTISVVDLETGAVYYSSDKGAALGAFYYSNEAVWTYTSASASLNWGGTDQNGNPLPDGTKTAICVTAVPEYYYDNEDAVRGSGLVWMTPITIDNTVPAAEIEKVTGDDGIVTGMNITVTDNQYVAAVILLNTDGEILGRYSINQTEAGVSTTLDPISLEGLEDSALYVAVLDYAGNETDYRVKLTDAPDVTVADGITLSETSIRVLKGSEYTLQASVSPSDIVDRSVSWSSDNENVARVNQNGVVIGVSEGTATITATTNAEPYLTATCQVEVFMLDDETLNGILWDEVGGVHWVDFNTNDLSKYNVVADSEHEFMAATVVGDKIFAAAYKEVGTNLGTDIYVIDPSNGYSAALAYEFADNQGAMTDMTYLPSVGDGGMILGSYASYLVLFSPSQNEWMGVFNMASYVDSGIVGVTYAGSGFNTNYNAYMDYIYLVTQNGTLYVSALMGLDGEYYHFGATVAGDLGYDTGDMFYFNSLYYDIEKGNIWWSAFDYTSDKVTLIMASEETGDVYRLGDFNDSVWPVGGLYKASDLLGTLKYAENETLDTATVAEELVLTQSLEQLPALIRTR